MRETGDTNGSQAIRAVGGRAGGIAGEGKEGTERQGWAGVARDANYSFVRFERAYSIEQLGRAVPSAGGKLLVEVSLSYKRMAA